MLARIWAKRERNNPKKDFWTLPFFLVVDDRGRRERGEGEEKKLVEDSRRQQWTRGRRREERRKVREKGEVLERSQRDLRGEEERRESEGYKMATFRWKLAFYTSKYSWSEMTKLPLPSFFSAQNSRGNFVYSCFMANPRLTGSTGRTRGLPAIAFRIGPFLDWAQLKFEPNGFRKAKYFVSH